MARTPKAKNLVNTRLASGYGGWIYCDNCGENIGYLCYVTYDEFHLSYQCKCGSPGRVDLEFPVEDNVTVTEPEDSNSLITIKNRLCCPEDNSPLFTILSQKLVSCSYKVVCTACKRKYIK